MLPGHLHADEAASSLLEAQVRVTAISCLGFIHLWAFKNIAVSVCCLVPPSAGLSRRCLVTTCSFDEPTVPELSTFTIYEQMSRTG